MPGTHGTAPQRRGLPRRPGSPPHSRPDHRGRFLPPVRRDQHRASGPYPDDKFISILRGNWESAVAEVLEFSGALRGGKGLPVVFTEHGLVPYNRTTTKPSSAEFVGLQPVDPDEQVAGYDALLQATRGLGSRLHEITFWHWGMEGCSGSAWYTSADYELSRRAGEFLADYVVSNNG